MQSPRQMLRKPIPVMRAPAFTVHDILQWPHHKIETFVRGMTEADLLMLFYEWRFWSRPAQVSPIGDWYIWLILAGRGWGKTKTAVQWAIEEVMMGRKKRLALVARTAADVRDVLVEGESGILASSPPYFRPSYEPSKRRLTWPNGAVATTFSADEPNLLRGPQFDGALCDELAAWRYSEAWDMLQFGVRLGRHPQIVASTTPRPTTLIKELVGDARNDPRTGAIINPNGRVYITKGHSFENRLNLADSFFDVITKKYEGTQLGRQELAAELLDDIAGSLARREWFERSRVLPKDVPSLNTIAIGVDPPGGLITECGIVAVGDGTDGHGYCLEDWSIAGSPEEWAKRASGLYHYLNAEVMVAESNFGGQMVESTIKLIDPTVNVKVVHASRGKRARAEPVSALIQKGLYHHVGSFPEMEDEWCTWIPGESDNSPNRLDAAVWAATEVLIGTEEEARVL